MIVTSSEAQEAAKGQVSSGGEKLCEGSQGDSSPPGPPLPAITTEPWGGGRPESWGLGAGLSLCCCCQGKAKLPKPQQQDMSQRGSSLRAPRWPESPAG